jgi:hypothetical protein
MKLLLLFSALLLIACAAKPGRDDSSYGANVGIVNHTGRFVYSASVDGGGGGHMEAWGAGAASVCCVMVPRKWIAGMQMLVSWDMPEGSKHVVKEKRVAVERYDEPGSVFIHFFPDDEIRIVVSNYGGWSTAHPIPPPVRPSAQRP